MEYPALGARVKAERALAVLAEPDVGEIVVLFRKMLGRFHRTELSSNFVFADLFSSVPNYEVPCIFSLILRQ